MKNYDKIFCRKKFSGICSSVEMVKGTCLSVEMLKGYILICRNVEGVQG